jgi:hypothetical protein
LDTAAIGGFIFEADAFYQPRLAQNLRDTGFVAELDYKTGAALMPVIPDEIRTLFRNRTAAGEMLARKATPDRGEEWEELSQAQPEQDRDQKARGGKDDVADTADWLREAKAVGWEPPRSLQLYGTPPSVLSPGSARHTMSLCRSSRSGWSISPWCRTGMFALLPRAA